MGCHVLLHGMFPTRDLNPHLLYWQAGSLPLPSPGKPTKVVGAIKLHGRLKTKLNTKMCVIQPLPILLCGRASLNLINLVVAKAHNE